MRGGVENLRYIARDMKPAKLIGGVVDCGVHEFLRLRTAGRLKMRIVGHPPRLQEFFIILSPNYSQCLSAILADAKLIPRGGDLP